MSITKERKAETHEAILNSAKELIRNGGIRSVSIASVMNKIGMTVGGFYAHFSNKDELVAKTLYLAIIDSWKNLASSEMENASQDRAKNLLAIYLSKMHCEHPELGCPIPSVISEMPSQPEIVQKSFNQGIQDCLHLMHDTLELDREKSISVLAMIVGGLELARASKTDSFTDEILKACREQAEKLIQSK